MRAFVAIALPEAATDALMQVQTRLPVGRIVPRANLHLTLAFLDDQPVQVLEALHEELAALPLTALILDLSGLGCYGGDRPRLVFAQAVPTAALGELRRQVLGAVRRAGILLPRRRFHPHVTLARVRASPAAAPSAVPGCSRPPMSCPTRRRCWPRTSCATRTMPIPCASRWIRGSRELTAARWPAISCGR